MDAVVSLIPSESFKKFNTFLNTDLYFNDFVSTGLETIIEFSLAGFIWIKVNNYSESGEIVGAAVAIHGLLCAYIILPLAIILMFFKTDTQIDALIG